MAKFSEVAVIDQAVFALSQKGHSIREIGKILGMTKTSVGRTLRQASNLASVVPLMSSDRSATEPDACLSMIWNAWFPPEDCSVADRLYFALCTLNASLLSAPSRVHELVKPIIQRLYCGFDTSTERGRRMAEYFEFRSLQTDDGRAAGMKELCTPHERNGTEPLEERYSRLCDTVAEFQQTDARILKTLSELSLVRLCLRMDPEIQGNHWRDSGGSTRDALAGLANFSDEDDDIKDSVLDILEEELGGAHDPDTGNEMYRDVPEEWFRALVDSALFWVAEREREIYH
ncbi:hypothetical protein ACTXJ8_14855 [Corynebacterium variabile]|uniref:hypothetical protein n=1 Tax=Corynebacterium variabile TaxID=1727 RepID=UPI003FD5F35B